VPTFFWRLRLPLAKWPCGRTTSKRKTGFHFSHTRAAFCRASLISCSSGEKVKLVAVVIGWLLINAAEPETQPSGKKIQRVGSAARRRPPNHHRIALGFFGRSRAYDGFLGHVAGSNDPPPSPAVHPRRDNFPAAWPAVRPGQAERARRPFATALSNAKENRPSLATSTATMDWTFSSQPGAQFDRPRNFALR